MKTGYALTTPFDQNPDAQIQALKKAGCADIFHDELGEKHKEQREKNKMLRQLKDGDVLVVQHLNILAESLNGLEEVIEDLIQKNIGLISLEEKIDSRENPDLCLQLVKAINRFEHELISRRTKEGLEIARQQGRTGGRPRGLDQEAQKIAEKARKLYKEGNKPVKEICQQLGIAKSTFYTYLKAQEVETGRKTTGAKMTVSKSKTSKAQEEKEEVVHLGGKLILKSA